MADWKIDPHYQHLSSIFGDLDKVFALEGERLTFDRVSEVIRFTYENTRYYIKRYKGAGKGLRKVLGRPRIKAEWQNLKLFEKWGIPTAHIIAWGLERNNLGAFKRGAMITQEIANTIDLSQLVETQDSRLQDRHWVNTISLQLATTTRIMHSHHFAHNDLKWRNLLVDDKDRLFFIDCPAGTFWYGPFFNFRRNKDLATLDKVAKYQLSQTQRLRFYLQYSQQTRLTTKDKQRIKLIVNLYEGRE